MPKKNEDMTGALWKKVSKKNGMEFYSGAVNVHGEQLNVAVFVNNYKVTEKSPDFNIVLSVPQDAEQSAEPQGQTFGDMQDEDERRRR